MPLSKPHSWQALLLTALKDAFGKMGSNLKPEQPAGLSRDSIETYLVSVLVWITEKVSGSKNLAMRCSILFQRYDDGSLCRGEETTKLTG